jgi:periplasmic divalent cation tolerance protein
MDEAKRIARQLIERKLCACTNLHQIKSIYPWEGKICEEDEVVIIGKTRSDKVEEVIETVRSIHSYEIPCILSFRIESGDGRFLEWVDAWVRGG